jgi:hypothetical protein
MLRTEAGDQGVATEAGQAADGGYQDNSTDELRAIGGKAFTPLLL